MAHHEFPVSVAKVHSAAAAKAEHVAIRTLALFSPATVPELFETIVPYLHEIVPIDIALIEIGTNARTT